MARVLRLSVLVFAVAVQPTSVASPVGPSGLTDEQQAFVTWGEDRFAAAGLVLPDVGYEFHDDTEPCGWHRGLYVPDTQVVIICSMNEDTLVHELAHAWAESNLSGADKAAFVERRGLPTWSSHDYRWALRGTEHVAEIIAWAVAPESELIRWVDYEEGERVSFRLLTIPDSEPHLLAAEYRRLTGAEPILRHPDEWSLEENPAASSPELARAGTAPADG